MSFSFSLFVSFLAIFQVLQCEFLILLVCQISCHIPVPTVCISHLHVFQCFSPYSRSYSVCVSFYTFFSFLATIQFQQFLSHFTRFFTASHHIPGPTLCVSHLALFSVLLTIFHVLAYEFLIFFVCHFSHHIPGPAGCLSHFSHFSLFLTTFHVLSCEFLIFFCFPVLSPSYRYYIVHFYFSTFFSFSRYIPCPTVCVCVCHIPRFQFFWHILFPTMCISLFIVFQWFWTYFTSYTLCFSFSMILSILASLQVLHCVFFIFHVFQFFFFCHIPGHTVFVSYFPFLSVFLHIEVLQCAFF